MARGIYRFINKPIIPCYTCINSLSYSTYVSQYHDHNERYGPEKRGGVQQTFAGDFSVSWDAIYCTNPLCNDHDVHVEQIQLFHDSIVDMCLLASELCIPHTSDNNNISSNIAGWNDIVKPYEEASLFWHQVWKDCGSPRNAAIADVKRRARAQYH